MLRGTGAISTTRGHNQNKARPGPSHTGEGHGFVDHAAGDVVAAVFVDPGEVVLVLVRRGQLQDLSGLLEDRVQRLSFVRSFVRSGQAPEGDKQRNPAAETEACLLYTSDAADE